MSQFDSQVGGDHYKKLPKEYQPIVIGQVLNLKPWEFNVLKRIIRHRYKNGVEDLYKAIHEIEIGIELEYAKSSSSVDTIKATQSSERSMEVQQEIRDRCCGPRERKD